MWQSAQDYSEDHLFVAGQKVPPGIYREISSLREVRLEEEDTLPASLDGRVACYVCISAIRLTEPSVPITQH